MWKKHDFFLVRVCAFLELYIREERLRSYDNKICMREEIFLIEQFMAGSSF